MSPTQEPIPKAPTFSSAGLVRRRPWYRRYPVAAFLVSLVLTFASSPFEEQMRFGDLIEVLRLTLMMVTGLLALSLRRRDLVFGIVLVTPALVFKWLNHWWPDQIPDAVFLVPGLVFLLFFLLHLFHYILRAPRIDSEVLCAGVAGYLLLGLLWSVAYILTARLVPGSFVFTVGPETGHVMKGFTALYYSFITLTTVGYGDIVPLAGPARMLAMMEAMLGTIYMTVLVARLVSLYSTTLPPASGEGE